MEKNSKGAVNFLRQVYPDDLWLLTAIRPDRQFIETRTFSHAESDDCLEWVERFNGTHNIYWSVNPPVGRFDKKAERTDIARVCYLHVDVDPREGEDLGEERERIARLFGERLPDGVPEPTFVIDSGGGYQGFWKLCEPIVIDGDAEKAEDAKRYNQQLEVLFRADACHNIDRIMRLPGTVNVPDAKKLKKGRTEALARAVTFDLERVYNIEQFKKAAPVQSPGSSAAGGILTGGRPTVELPGNIDRVDDLSELDPYSVPTRCKVAIAQGRDVDHPLKNDNSRSGWLHYVCCELARCQVPDEVIYSLITDKDWGISESVLDKGRRAHTYALRQIERGKESAIDPHLTWMNERHAIIGNFGGKCLVVQEVEDDFGDGIKRSRLTKQGFIDIKHRYQNKLVDLGEDKDGNPVRKPLGEWWLQHPARREYERIVFAPEKEVPLAYNLWQGFSVESVPGDCSLFLEHVRENICAGDDSLYDYVIKWMARAVQNPGTPGEVALVLRGGRGTGKSLFVTIFGSLFGRHFMHISSDKHLVGSFNSHLRDVVVLFSDEAFFAGDKKHRSVLNTLITEKTLTIEAKGVDAEQSPNFIHLVMASNDEHVVPAGDDERRYAVLDVADGWKQDDEKFGAMLEQVENGGREALLHHLMSVDISRFSPRPAPQTRALYDQKILSLSSEESWWMGKLESGNILDHQPGWQRRVPVDLLVDDYIAHADRFKIPRRASATVLGRFLTRICPGIAKVRQAGDQDFRAPDGKLMRRYDPNARWYVLPPLKDCRAHWDSKYPGTEWGPLPEVDSDVDEGDNVREYPF